MKVVRLILFILNLVLALALCLSLLAPYISPKLFWPFAIFGLAFAPLFLLNALFAIYWALQLKFRALISAGVLFLSFPYLTKIVNFKTSENEQSAASIHVISHNTRAFQNEKHKRIEPDDYMKTLRTEEPDIICFQEYADWYYGKKKVKSNDIKQLLNMKLFGHDRFRELYRGLVIATRLPVVESKSKYFGSNTSNGLMHADIIIPGGDTIRVINFHLESIGLSSREALKLDDMGEVQEKAMVKSKNLIKRLRNAFINRAEQADILRKWIDESPYPLIICGDMNDTPVSYAYRKISRGLNDAFINKGSYFGTTYSGPWPSYRIDYIFTSNGLRIENFQSLGNFHSDHKAAKAGIVLSN